MGGVVRPGRAALALALAATLAATLAAPLAGPLAAQSPADSARASRQPLFTRRDALAAGVVIGGAVLLMSTVDEPIARSITDEDGRLHSDFAREASGVVKFVNERSLFAVSAGSWLVGLGTRSEGLARFGVHSMEALLATAAIQTVVKGSLGRARPFITREAGEYDAFDLDPFAGFGKTGDRRSMPSLHVGGAMAFSTVLSDELDRWRPGEYRWVRPVLYTVSVLPGIARIYTDKHWVSDVVVGAAIGYGVGRKVSRYTRTHPTNRVDRWLLRDAALGSDASGAFTVGWTVATPF